MSNSNKFRGWKASQEPWQKLADTRPSMAQSKAVAPPLMEHPYSPGDLIANRYEVLQILGGGMGVIFLCLDHSDELPVALKTFRPEYLSNRDARDRFLREGNIWVQLSGHPHIVRAYNVEHIGGVGEVYLVLEWVAPAEGKNDASLQAWLASGRPLPIEQALVFALHIARGMKHATTKIPGLVHRDLKPANILVGRDGNARVTDFGLASILADLDRRPFKPQPANAGLNHRTQLTRDGIAGTPLYMAPEQWTGAPLDMRTDIYAFGCILYEMLTGSTAVDGRDLDELQWAHRSGCVGKLPPGLSSEMNTLIQRCLATNREARYLSWAEVEAAIAEAYWRETKRRAPGEGMIKDETRAEKLARGWSYYAIGHSYIELGKYEVAAKYLDRMVHIGRTGQDRRLERVGLAYLGVVYAKLGDARRSVQFSQQVLDKMSEEGLLAQEWGHILCNLGNAHRDLGDVPRAIKLFEQALEVADGIGDQDLEATVLSSLGNAYRRLGEVQRAIDLYDRALTISRDLKDRVGEGVCLGNLGIAYRNLGKPSEAIRFCEQALSIAREIGDRASEGQHLANLGNAYADLGHIQQGIEFSEQALAITRETGNRRGEAIALDNLGVAYAELGDVQQATRFYEQSIAIAQEIGDIMGVARTGRNLAILLVKQGRHRDALPYLEIAAQVYEQVGHKQLAEKSRQLIDQIRDRVKADEHWNRGVAYADQGHWKDAIREYHASLRINPHNAVVRYNLGVAYWQLGHLDQAIHELEFAVRVIPNLPEAHFTLGMVYGKRGQFADAIRELRVAWQMGFGPARDVLIQLGQL